MNIENAIASAFPGWGLRRAKARAYTRLYDAAQQTNYHKSIKSGGYSADAVMDNSGAKLRAWARYLDENHDLAIGILDTLVNNIIGTGLVIEPMVTKKNGDLHEDLNNQLRDLWLDFWDRPEVTGELPGPEVERMLCRSWLRDGEVLTQHVVGRDKFITHTHEVPYSIELIEADLLPFELTSRLVPNMEGVIHGVQKNAWGKPINYLLYKQHPGDVILPGSALNFNFADVKVVPAEFITHLKFTRRVKQTRGVPVLHGVIQRLADIKDYEESERIAARIAASWTGFITRSIDMAQNIDATTGNRTMEMAAGMIFDNLLPGEEPKLIGSNRPNSSLGEYRNDMLRAVSSGTGTNNSSISKNYNGTYSAQRQEMVESRPSYQRMTNYFSEAQMIPIWSRFVDMSVTANMIRIPSNVIAKSIYYPQMRGPALPGVDLKKEIEADALAVDYAFKSRPQVIRERGGDPVMVDKERMKDTAAPVKETKTPIQSLEDYEAQQAEEDAQAA